MSENLKPNLIAQNLPVLQSLEPTLVAVPAIETSWEKYPLYLEVKSAVYVNTVNGVLPALKGDVIVWDENKKVSIKHKATWDYMYGKFLREKEGDLENVTFTKEFWKE